MNHQHSIEYADDDTESVRTLVRLRFPSLICGLFLGIAISFLTSRFEEVLSKNIQVAYFLPFVIYMAAAVGTQTEAIYSRDLKSGRASFHRYLVKESALGLVLGVVFGVVSGFIVEWWLKDTLLSLSVGFSMFTAVMTAPLIALLITEIMQVVHEDPAVGSGPIATVVQDMLSVVIYGTICSMLLL